MSPSLNKLSFHEYELINVLNSDLDDFNVICACIYALKIFPESDIGRKFSDREQFKKLVCKPIMNGKLL